VPERGDTPGNEVARSPVRWQEIAESAEFRRLESLRRRAMAATLGISTRRFVPASRRTAWRS